MRGGAELVALWAQLASVIDVITGVALSGVATGLAVYVARTRRPERQRDLLREALRIGLLVSLPVALAIGAGGWSFGERLSGGKLMPALFLVSAAAGWIAVVPGIVNGYWLGRQRRGLMLALALGSAAVALGAALLAPADYLLEALALSQATPALAMLFVVSLKYEKPRFRAHAHPLRRYVLPGLSIGILSPLSMLIARGAVGESLSWHEAGVLQALWRISDWVCAFAAGILSVHYLPRFAGVRGRPEMNAVLKEAAKAVLLPSALVFALLLLLHRPLLAGLYDPSVQASNAAVAILFAGNLLRIAAWIPLFALYAMRRTGSITVGEILSLPLFAGLVVVLSARLTLELVAVLWLLSFAAYGAYNLWAVRKAD